MLEDRTAPAVDVWTGAADSNWWNGANWSAAAAPGPLDDVVFDGHYSNNDCVFTNSNYSQAANSLTMQNGYSGTLHLQSYGPWGIGPGGINQSSGDIEQETGQDIEVGGNYNWSGGDINVNSPFVANVNMYQPGTSMPITGNGMTGSTLDVKNGTVITMSDPNGTTTFTKKAGISVEAGGTFNWLDGNIASPAGGGVIANAGTMQKMAGINATTQDALPIQNTGTFLLQASTLTISQKDANGHGYSQTDGTTTLSNIAQLGSSLGDVYINGGAFQTVGLINTILAKATFNGGTISLNYNATATGTLIVNLDVNIQGNAAWTCKVDCSGTTADQIRSNTTITVGGNSTFTAQGINLPKGRVPLRQTWDFLVDTAGNAINGAFARTTLVFNDGTNGSWTIGKVNGNTKWQLRS